MQQREAEQPWKTLVTFADDIARCYSRAGGQVGAPLLQELQSGAAIVLKPVHQSPQTPMGSCESLVYTMKVPQRLTEAGITLMCLHSSMGPFLVGVLESFLSMMAASGALQEAVSPSELRPTRLAAAIDKQLQQAGLYQHLAQACTDIVTQLAATDATPDFLATLEHSPVGSADEQQRDFTIVIRGTAQALTLYSLLTLLWPMDSTPAAWDPAIDTAVMSLALTTAQQVSKWLDAMPASSPEPYLSLPGLLQLAWTAIAPCALRRKSDPAALQPQGRGNLPRFAPLLLSQQYMAALCLGAFYGCHSSIMAAELEANSSTMSPASGSSTASSSSNRGRGRGSNGSQRSQNSSSKGSVGKREAADAASGQQQNVGAGSSSEQQGSQWARACSRAQQLSTRQQELLQVLQCSGKVLLWAALTNAAALPTVPYALLGLATAYKQVGELEEQIAGPNGLAQEPLDEQTAALHVLLPGVLLPWAASQHKTDINFVLSCVMVGKATEAAVHAVHRRRMLLGADERVKHKLAGIVPDLVLVLERLLATARVQTSCGGQQLQTPVDNATINEALWALSSLLPLLAAFCSFLHAVTPFTWYPDRALSELEGLDLEPHTWQPHAAKVLAVWESHMRLPYAWDVLDDPARQYQVPFMMLADLCAVGEQAQPNALAAAAIAAGFGSTEQQHLFSLLCSLVKRSGMLGVRIQTEAEACRLIAGSVAARLAQLYATEAAASSTAAGATPAAASSCRTQLLPWLVLFGRCCLQWARQLRWRHKGIPGLPDAAAVQQAEPLSSGFMGLMDIDSSSDVFFQMDWRRARVGPIMSLFLTALQAPLQHAGVSAQLSAAGLDAGALLAKVSSAKAAVDAGRADQPDVIISAVKDLGQALTSLPCATACNNPLCTNLSEPSEMQLVQGSHHKCSACRTARYCGKACQAKHWKQHKPVCKALVAAAAGKGSAAAAAPHSPD